MKLVCSITIFLLLGLSLAQENEDICRVLALSGGANKGAYEAGVIYELSHSLEPSEVNWQVISGVSAGSINTGGISLFPIGEEAAMSEFLIDTLMGLTTTDVWKFWPDGLIDGLLNQKGIVDDTPLLETLQGIYAQFGTVEKELVIGTVNTRDGKYTTYDETRPHDEIPTVILASSSMPAIFPPTTYDNEIFMDGGTVWNTNMASGIQKCRKHVDSDEKIVVDIAICSYIEEYETPADPKTTIDNFMRYRQIKKHYSSLDDIITFMQAFPNATYRYFFAPSEPLVSGIQELLFTEEILGPMVEVGKADVQRVLAMGETTGFAYLQEWQSNQSLHKQFSNFNDYYHSQV